MHQYSIRLHNLGNWLIQCSVQLATILVMSDGIGAKPWSSMVLESHCSPLAIVPCAELERYVIELEAKKAGYDKWYHIL